MDVYVERKHADILTICSGSLDSELPVSYATSDLSKLGEFYGIRSHSDLS